MTDSDKRPTPTDDARPRTGDVIDLDVEGFKEGDEVVLAIPDPDRPGRPRRYLAQLIAGGKARIITTRVREWREQR